MLRRRRLPALTGALTALTLSLAACGGTSGDSAGAVSYTHLTLPTNREV